MSIKLRQYLIDAYEARPSAIFRFKSNKSIPIQIDDQDDLDRINEFCNIFCNVKSNSKFSLELIGNFPISSEIADLAEIYNGFADPLNGRIYLELSPERIGVLTDLADKIRKTSFLGDKINNANWLPISARTISSLYRFVRIIKEYIKTAQKEKNKEAVESSL
jgi:hypothetical protein